MGSISDEIFFEHVLTHVKYHSILIACQEIFAEIFAALGAGWRKWTEPAHPTGVRVIRQSSLDPVRRNS
jgi:hypothetical protein